MKKILFVVSAADHWTLKDGTLHPSGYWAEEVAIPHQIFSEAGWDITIATPGGKAPTLDKLSLSFTAGTPWKRRAVQRYLDKISNQLNSPRSLASINPDDFDIVFYPGGHGPMEDLAHDTVSGDLLAHVLSSGKPLALLCHAPAATLAAKTPKGDWPFKGYRMTGLSNREELLNTFAHKASWLLEDRLREKGADYVKGGLLRPFVVIDRNLYTGQNPASSEKLANRLVAEMSEAALHVTVSRIIAAPKEELHAFISDITHMGEISPENHETRWVQPGKRFIGHNAIGPFYRWSMGGTVTENVPGEAFGFLTDSPSETHWRYTFESVNGGTRVTESMRKHRPQLPFIVFLQDISGARNRQSHLENGMRMTLERLARKFEKAK